MFFDFINDFFTGLVTLLAGLVALVVYMRQKYDAKRDAANIILLEIQNAERGLKLVRDNIQETELLDEDVFIMPTQSWDKYKYLFVRDFDRDSWDNICTFYNKCLLYDEAVRYNNSCFRDDANQIRQNLQRVLADYTKKFFDESKRDKKEFDENAFQESIEGFRGKYMHQQGSWLYKPQKSLMDARRHLFGLENLSQTIVGIKLRKLAGIKI
jgi:hypothetical protein